MIIELFVVMGLIGGVFAFLMAFIITFEEYQRHHFENTRLKIEALTVGIFAFIIILIFMTISGLIMNIILTL